MANLKLPYTMTDTDRHGNVRWYVRVKQKNGKFRKTRIKSDPGTNAFISEYERELELLLHPGEPETISSPRMDPSTLEGLIHEYFASGEFYELAEGTRLDKRSTLLRVAESAGKHPYKAIQKSDIQSGRDKRLETPHAANKFIKHMRGLYDWAIERKLVDQNPAEDVKKLKGPPRPEHAKGWHSWTPEEMDAFRATHPIGSTARLVFELHSASLRASDVKVIGFQHVRGDHLDFIQTKTKQRHIQPIHADLRACIDAEPKDRLHMVVNQYGRPFAKGYTAAFKRWARAAGIPHCTSHGIRKGMAAELANLGASELEIAAYLGQTGTQSVKHYTVGADKLKLATRAAERRKKG